MAAGGGPPQLPGTRACPTSAAWQLGLTQTFDFGNRSVPHREHLPPPGRGPESRRPAPTLRPCAAPSPPDSRRERHCPVAAWDGG